MIRAAVLALGLAPTVAGLAACHPPPVAAATAIAAAPVDALLAAEAALFSAIAARDAARLGDMVGEDFILRVPGAPDVDKAGFLAGMAAIPGELLEVRGEALAARPLGVDRGLVSGVQVSRLRVDGQLLEDRQVFVDVFERRAGRWQVTFASSVALPAGAPGAR